MNRCAGATLPAGITAIDILRRDSFTISVTLPGFHAEGYFMLRFRIAWGTLMAISLLGVGVAFIEGPQFVFPHMFWLTAGTWMLYQQ